ncbi:MAG: RNA 2'-phosphotransferase [Gemmataceae bacterium]
MKPSNKSDERNDAKKRMVQVSKYLSKCLRHQPEQLGLNLKPGGWVVIEELLNAAANNGFPISRLELVTVVETNEKKRFAFDETGTLIRANQGHSVPIDLQLAPAEPPEVLYHGTAEKNVLAILEQGLQKMNRHHVHLSLDRETATIVGQRHGKPVVFEIPAKKMHDEGFVFYCSENSVWLVEEVPAEYLRKRN